MLDWWVGAAAGAPFFLPGLAGLVMGPPRPRLRDYEPLERSHAPPVTVVVPARNESNNIDRCVRSILKSDYPNFDLIVVDDRSTDDTFAVATRAIGRDPRARVLRGAEVPKGWYGKPWACWQGYKEASGELLLFTDSDTEHGVHLLSRTVAALKTEKVDLLTVFPRQEMVGFWERIIQPYFFLLLALRYGSAKRMNRNRNPRHAIANGQFILATRDSYDWVGGHQKVHDTVVEDLMIAVRYIETGRRVFFVLAEEDMKVRMYHSLGQAVEGWSKNFFRGVLHTMKLKPLAYLACLASIAIDLAMLLPLAAIVLALSQNVVGAGLVPAPVPAEFQPALLAFGVTSYLGIALLFGAVLRISKAPMIYGLFFPLGSLATAWIITRAIVRGTGRVEWKGRTYSHA